MNVEKTDRIVAGRSLHSVSRVRLPGHTRKGIADMLTIRGTTDAEGGGRRAHLGQGQPLPRP